MDDWEVLWESIQDRSHFEGVYRLPNLLVQILISENNPVDTVTAYVWSPISRRWNQFSSLYAQQSCVRRFLFDIDECRRDASVLLARAKLALTDPNKGEH